MREEREQRRKVKKIKLYVGLAVTVVIVILVVFLLNASMFDVADYEIQGNVYYTADEIKTMADCKTGENIFIGTDYKDMKKRLERDPYFKKVKFHRELPSTVVVEIDERPQIAALVYGENYIVVSDDMTVLRKSSVAPKVPIVRGLALTELTMGATLGVEDELFLNEVMDIIKATDENDMYFKEIIIEKNQATCYILDNLRVEGKAQGIIDVLNSGDLHSVVQELFDRDIERGVITVSGEGYVSFSPRI